MTKFRYAFLIVVSLVVGCTIPSCPVSPGVQEDGRVRLATCLNERGWRLYGASWCHFCDKQLELFGPEAAARLDYIDCSPPGDAPDNPACAAAGIEAYPTWVAPNGKKYEGLRTLESLAAASRCPAP